MEEKKKKEKDQVVGPTRKRKKGEQRRRLDHQTMGVESEQSARQRVESGDKKRKKEEDGVEDGVEDVVVGKRSRLLVVGDGQGDQKEEQTSDQTLRGIRKSLDDGSSSSTVVMVVIATVIVIAMDVASTSWGVCEDEIVGWKVRSGMGRRTGDREDG